MGKRVYKKKVLLDFGCFANILSSSIESYKKEAFGIIGGEERKKGIILMAAPPLLSARRGKNFVDYKRNPKKYKLAKELINVYGLDLVGCYHSHPDSYSFPTEDDLISALNEISESEYQGISTFDWWLELIVSLTKKNYKRNYSPYFCFDETKGNYISGHIKHGGIGWAIEIRGHWVECQDLGSEGFWSNRKPANLDFSRKTYPSDWTF